MSQQNPPPFIFFILLFIFLGLMYYTISNFIAAAQLKDPWPKWFIVPVFLFLGLGMIWIFAKFSFWITGRNKYVLTFIVTIVFVSGPIVHLVRWGRNLVHGKQVKDHFSTVDGFSTLNLLDIPIQSLGTILISALSLGISLLGFYVLCNVLYALLF